jgi:ketosteroid isomerase-like protein
MKRILALITLVALGLAGALSAAGPEDAIVAAEKQWAKSVVAGDFAALEKILHPKLIYAHSTGVIESKPEYLGKMRTGAQKYDGIEHEKTSVLLFGNTAVAHSIVRMRGNTKGEPFNNHLMLMHVWAREGGSWQLAAHQTTRLAQ